jgi:hypothetical protein
MQFIDSLNAAIVQGMAGWFLVQNGHSLKNTENDRMNLIRLTQNCASE